MISFKITNQQMLKKVNITGHTKRSAISLITKYWLLCSVTSSAQNIVISELRRHASFHKREKNND